MAIKADVVDGKLQYNYTDNSKTGLQATGDNLGYDQFLQLLCAEMQYQDPLEPTSNTDYVAQLATFSQLEATLSLQNTETSTMANSLIGKQVILKVDSSTTGATTYVDGRVDYVLYQDGEVLLSVNDQLYNIDTLDTVADSEYYDAVATSKSFSNMIAALPDIGSISASYATAIQQLRDVYDGMTSYQKGYVSTDDVAKLSQYEARVKELVAAQEAAKQPETNTEEIEKEEKEEV